jgi:hypothetical protein
MRQRIERRPQSHRFDERGASIMKRTTKFALVAGSALTIALSAVAVNAHPEGGWGGPLGYGMGSGHMGYGMGGGGHMGSGMGYGGYMGYGMGPGSHMGYGGMGLNGVLAGFPGDVTERLETLKSTLGITQSQEAAWQSFADSATKQAQNRLAWFDKMHQAQTPRTTPEWLAQQDEAIKQHQADRQAVTSALKKLYDELTPEQRALIDRGSIAGTPRYGAR